MAIEGRCWLRLERRGGMGCSKLSGVRDYWCSLSFLLSHSWSGLRRHAWYCRSECSCGRYDKEVIDPNACDGDWWRCYVALAASKRGCVHSCVQLIEGEKGEPERRPLESINFVLLWNINESIVAYCDFIIISKLNDFWWTMFLYRVECGAVIAHVVRCFGVDDPCSWSGSSGECGCIIG